MIERAGIALLLIGLAFGAYSFATRWQVARVTRITGSQDVLAGLRKGVPAVIYFWSEDCAPCKAIQSPAVKRLLETLGPDDVQIVEINAVEHPEIAARWGVLSLPTTFIVDRMGECRQVNHGVIRAEQLERQVLAYS
jgi:thiol-disulfide isomerase/thioredoxin